VSKMISNIVFTMNRPLQLEAYLDSLYRHLPPEHIQTYILYKVALFDEQYSELFARFPQCVVIREQDFHADFMNLINGLDSKYVLFGTDDVVYYDSVDWAVIDQAFADFPEQIFGFSLRLSPESLQPSDPCMTQLKCANQTIYRINWQQTHNRNARYPFELNSTVYSTPLVQRILKAVGREHPTLQRLFRPESMLVKVVGSVFHLKDFLVSIETFRNPNTLEGYCYRWCKTHKRQFPKYLFFQKLCASAIQINRVNTAIDNPVDGSDQHTVETLNEEYRKGYRFDIEAIERNKPEGTHVGREYFRLAKRT